MIYCMLNWICVVLDIWVSSRFEFQVGHTVNIYSHGLGMIIGNTFVILVYRYFTYKFFILIAIIIFIMANIGTNI